MHAIRQGLTPGLEQLVTALLEHALVQVVGVVVRLQEPPEVRVGVVAEGVVVVVVEEGAAGDVVAVDEELEVTNGGEDQFRRREKLFDHDDLDD